MAILIVGGLGLLGYGVYSKLGGSVKSDAPAADNGDAPPVLAAPSSVPAETTLSSFGGIALNQPAGSRIAEATTAGTLMTLRIEGGGRTDRVVVIDLNTGRVAGWIHVGSVDGEASTAAQ